MNGSAVLTLLTGLLEPLFRFLPLGLLKNIGKA